MLVVLKTSRWLDRNFYEGNKIEEQGEENEDGKGCEENL